MSEIKEIGIERECWLTREEEIIEPSLYGFNFCSDEMGFLIEERSFPNKNLEPIVLSLEYQHTLIKHRANFFGMDISFEPMKNATKEFVDKIKSKYKILDSPDLTKNIYPKYKNKSHHLGIFENKYGCYDLTAGMHIHFSSRDTEGNIIKLPVEDIVKQMDEVFIDILMK